jgi:uncharacterized membrane protein YkvA (DUF1232 family)
MPWWGWLLAGMGASVLLLAATAFLLRRCLRRLRDDPLARRIAALPLRAKAALAWRLFRDRRLPLGAKVLLPALALYLALPFDLIPDFIPVLGYLDDLLVVLLVSALLLRALPRDVVEENVRSLTSDSESKDGPQTTSTGEGRGR